MLFDNTRNNRIKVLSKKKKQGIMGNSNFIYKLFYKYFKVIVSNRIIS